jgi:hypothetical protein
VPLPEPVTPLAPPVAPPVPELAPVPAPLPIPVLGPPLVVGEATSEASGPTLGGVPMLEPMLLLEPGREVGVPRFRMHFSRCSPLIAAHWLLGVGVALRSEGVPEPADWAAASAQ